MSPTIPPPINPVLLKTIYVSTEDYGRLRLLARSLGGGNSPAARSARHLSGELDRALMLPSHELPPGIVQLGSEVTIEDLESGELETYILAMPEQANADQGRISVLAPIGTALLGYAAGDELTWETPGGIRRLRIRSSRQPQEMATPLPY